MEEVASLNLGAMSMRSRVKGMKYLRRMGFGSPEVEKQVLDYCAQNFEDDLHWESVSHGLQAIGKHGTSESLPPLTSVLFSSTYSCEWFVWLNLSLAVSRLEIRHGKLSMEFILKVLGLSSKGNLFAGEGLFLAMYEEHYVPALHEQELILELLCKFKPEELAKYFWFFATSYNWTVAQKEMVLRNAYPFASEEGREAIEASRKGIRQKYASF